MGKVTDHFKNHNNYIFEIKLSPVKIQTVVSHIMEVMGIRAHQESEFLHSQEGNTGYN